MLIALPWVLTACLGLTGSVDGPKLSGPPQELTQLCDRPVKLNNVILTQQQTENLWRTDRVALINCGETKELLMEYYADRDSRIQRN